MIRNGFLSINHDFYDKKSIDYCYYTLGTSIMSGSGVCRNLAPFLTDLLKECDYTSYNVEMKFLQPHIYRLSNDDYNSEEVEESVNSNNIRRKIAVNLSHYIFNHATTLYANQDKSYIMDLRNNTFYCIHGNQVYPYFSDEIVKTNLERDWCDKRLKIDHVSSAQLDKAKIVELYCNVRRQCDDTFYTFQKFYLEHRELYEEIVFQRKEFVEKQLKIKSLLKI